MSMGDGGFALEGALMMFFTFILVAIIVLAYALIFSHFKASECNAKKNSSSDIQNKESKDQ